MRRSNLRKVILCLSLIIAGPTWAQMIYEIKNPKYFTTVVKDGHNPGDQFKVFSPEEENKPMAIAELRKCDDKFCLYFVKKIRKNTVLQSGYRLEKAIVKKTGASQTQTTEASAESKPSGRKWVGLSYGVPLPNVIRADFGMQNIKGSNYDIGVGLGMLPASLGGIDLSGQTLGVSGQLRVPDYRLFWNVIPKFIAEIGLIKGDLDLSSITKRSGDVNSITAFYGMAGAALSQQFDNFSVDLGIAYSVNTIESPQKAPSGNEVSAPFAGSVSLLMLNGSWIF